MAAIWQAILALPRDQQTLFFIVAFFVGAFAVRGAVSLFPRKKTHTLYVFDEHAQRPLAPRPVPARRIAQPEQPEDETARRSADTHEDAGAGAFADAGDEADAPGWTAGRSVCPVCGYPTGVNEVTESCVFCDWQEPEPPDPNWEVAPSERRDDLAIAKRNCAATGSALSREDRESWAGELTPHEVELRGELRSKFDLLRDGTPVDEDPWGEIDRISDELQQESRRKREA